MGASLGLVIAGLATIVFAVLLKRLNIVALSVKSMALCREASTVLLDKTVTDDVKETTAQRAAIAVAGVAIRIWLRLVLALAASSVVPVIAVWRGWCSEATLENAFLSWPILVFATLAFIWEFVVRR